MSGAQTSTGPDPNILYKALSGQEGIDVNAGLIANQQNQLLMPYRVQAAQQQVGDADMAAVGQASQALLNNYTDEASRAAAYPGLVADLQRQGFAKNAPSVYPGEQALKTIVARSLPVQTQYNLGLATDPAFGQQVQQILHGSNTSTPPAAPGGSPAPTRTGDFATDLATSESGGRPGIINSSGYTGLYQFGKQRLADLGYYTPAPGENMTDNTNWSGKVSIPGFNVTDQASFAANPAAQKVAFGTHLGNIDQAIDNTPGAANLDRNGLRAVAHLGGVDGMRRFAASGGAYNPADANGTRLSTYYQRFSGGGATPPASTAPGTTPPGGTTAVAATTPSGGKAVVIGDSLASSGGLGGSGVVGASPSAIRAQIADGARKGAYTGQDVVLSSGASNAPGDMANIEAQLKLLRDAGSVTLLGVGPGIEAKNPGTNAALQKLAAQYGARFQPLPADQMGPDGVHPTGAGYATLRTAVAPPGAAPQSGRYQVASNAPTPPPSATAPPASPAQPVAGPPATLPNPYVSLLTPPGAQNVLTPPAPQPQPPAAQPGSTQLPAQPPGPQANLPHAWEVPTGQQSAQFQQARQLEDQAAQLTALAATKPPNSPQARQALAYAASLTQKATELKGLDTIVQTQEGPVHVLTGQQDKPIEPLANYQFDPNAGGPGVPGFIDTTHTHEPKVSPARRLVQRPDGTVIDDTGRIVSPADLPGAAAAAAARTSGEAAGKQTGQLTAQLADQGRTSTQAIGNIDYGLSQIQKASEGGIPTGYCAPWLATLGAIGKSIGGDVGERIMTLGADPSAVGNIQTAGKTLAVVSGAILDQILGPGSQITDAKIQHFIHAQPGIETDPQALNRVLNWARSQFVYEREMAAQGMKDASATGLLPTNWQAQYYDKHGFAPIYNPGTGEMEQPEGRAPPREPPSGSGPPQTAPVNPSARTAGTTYSTPKGPMKWTGTGWVQP